MLSFVAQGLSLALNCKGVTTPDFTTLIQPQNHPQLTGPVPKEEGLQVAI